MIMDISRTLSSRSTRRVLEIDDPCKEESSLELCYKCFIVFPLVVFYCLNFSVGFAVCFYNKTTHDSWLVLSVLSVECVKRERHISCVMTEASVGRKSDDEGGVKFTVTVWLSDEQSTPQSEWNIHRERERGHNGIYNEFSATGGSVEQTITTKKSAKLNDIKCKGCKTESLCHDD